MLLDEIGVRLSGEGIATSSAGSDWRLIQSWLPDTSGLQNKVVAIIETPGEPPGAFTEDDRPHFQIIVRGNSILQQSSAYEEARTKIEDVKTDLHTLAPITLSGRYYGGIWAQQDPFLLQYDKRDRPHLVCNFRAIRSRT